MASSDGQNNIGTLQWYGLGPVSVLPEYQKMGIGKALIETGLVLEGVPQEVFFVLSFDDHIPRGNVTFHEGFKTTVQETSRED